jgi:folylpolyglutamate synthase/dihydropteroate synthase
VQRAIDLSTEDDVILVAGSLYAAGAARDFIESILHRTD